MFVPYEEKFKKNQKVVLTVDQSNKKGVFTIGHVFTIDFIYDNVFYLVDDEGYRLEAYSNVLKLFEPVLKIAN